MKYILLAITMNLITISFYNNASIDLPFGNVELRNITISDPNLEEIQQFIKITPVTTMHLFKTYLKDSSFAVLCKKYPDLKRLTITDPIMESTASNNIGSSVLSLLNDDDVQLQYLCLQSCWSSQHAWMSDVIKSCAQSKTMTELNMGFGYGVNHHFKTAGLAEITKLMLATTNIISKVTIPGNELDDADCFKLSVGLQFSKKLSDLSLMNNNITPDGAKTLITAINSNPYYKDNKKKLCLNITANPISKKEATELKKFGDTFDYNAVDLIRCY